MTVAINKAIPSHYSPNCPVSFWITVQESVTYLNQPVKLVIQGYFDQAGYTAKGVAMGSLPITIPADAVPGALADAASLGTYLLSLPQFSGGSIVQL